MNTRVEVLREIAGRYHELVSNSGSPGQPGSGDRIPLMPATYTQTVREFERLMAYMRHDRGESLQVVDGEKVSVRALRWHILEWYVNATHTIRHVPIQLKKGRKIALLHDQDGHAITTTPIVRWHRLPAAKETLADAGLAWMAAAWALRSEPMLPAELMDIAA